MDLKLRARGVKHVAVFGVVWEAVGSLCSQGWVGMWVGRKKTRGADLYKG